MKWLDNWMPSSIVHFVIPNTEPCLLFVLHFRRDLCTLFFFFASTCIWPTKTTDREREMNFCSSPICPIISGRPLGCCLQLNWLAKATFSAFQQGATRRLTDYRWITTIDALTKCLDQWSTGWLTDWPTDYLTTAHCGVCGCAPRRVHAVGRRCEWHQFQLTGFCVEYILAGGIIGYFIR